MNFFDQFDSIVKDIFDSINKRGKCYIVGGYVRDQLLGVSRNHDIDVEVYGLEANELEMILASFSTVNLIGKSFGVYKATCLPDFDFALARLETKTGNNHQHFDIVLDPNLTFKQAGLRRDLTINSILYDPYTDTYIDPFNGIEDLKNKTLKAVSTMTFIEDPLRVLRVSRFLAKLPEFKADEELVTICKQMADDLRYLSKERIYQEYTNILMSAMPSRGFNFLKEINALPEFLNKMTTTMQRLDFHPEGSVYNHTMLVIDLAALNKHKVSKPEYFMWAALMHDIGKIEVTTPEGKAPNHDLVGEKMAYDTMYHISKNKTLSKYVSIMTRTHMALMVAMRTCNHVTYLKVLKRIENIFDLEDLLLISKCDKLGRKRIDTNSIKKFDAYIKQMKNQYGTIALKPCINGNDLKNANYTNFKLYTKILEYAYTMQLKGHKKEEIMLFIKQKFKR